jgi:hypothetical protein
MHMERGLVHLYLILSIPWYALLFSALFARSFDFPCGKCAQRAFRPLYTRGMSCFPSQYQCTTVSSEEEMQLSMNHVYVRQVIVVSVVLVWYIDIEKEE